MKIIFLLFIALSLIPGAAFSITLDEAIKKAIGGSYLLKEQKDIVKRFEFSYISSIDPYLPRVDIQSSYTRSLNAQSIANSSSFSSASDVGTSRDAFAFTGTLSFRVFDGGERYAKRKGSYSLFEREKERYKSIQQDVLFSIKSAFYTALGSKLVVEKRQEAFNAAERIYKLTLARYQEGVTRKSDVLQAEVRLVTAKIDVQRAEREYEKALEDLKSLIFLKTEETTEADGPLVEPVYKGNYESLAERALRVKPEILTQEKEIERLNMAYVEKRSAWFPKIDTGIQQTRQDYRFFPEGRSDAFYVNFTFPLFDGVGRYYNMKGALSDVSAAKQRLEETKRTVKLDIVKALKDYELTLDNVRLYRELVRDATTTFDQLYGEYRVGKGDILSLIQSEKDLAAAKENEVGALYRANIALSFLEKAAYIYDE
jgi:outer membrane protein TolC